MSSHELPSPFPMAVELGAIILGGGRSSRLGGRDKAQLARDGLTLLHSTVGAARAVGAGGIVVVGPPQAIDGVVFVREEPPFAGPAAATAAGVAALDPTPIHTLVIGCDMPAVLGAVRALVAAVVAHPESSFIGHDDAGRPQPLVSLLRTADLRSAIDQLGGVSGLVGMPMRSVIARVRPLPVPLPPGSCDDVDTPADAARLGYSLD